MQSSFRPLAAVCSERNIDSSEPSFPRLPPPNQPNSPIRLFCLPICQAVRGALHWWAGSTPPAVRTGAHAFRQTEGAVKEIGVGGSKLATGAPGSESVSPDPGHANAVMLWVGVALTFCVTFCVLSQLGRARCIEGRGAVRPRGALAGARKTLRVVTPYLLPRDQWLPWAKGGPRYALGGAFRHPLTAVNSGRLRALLP